MKIKIRKNEALFSQEGLHILDEKGIAVLAQEDTECDIAEEHIERVKQIVIAQRLRYGLDENGDVPVAEEPVAEEPVAEEPVAEEPVAEEPVAEEPVAEEPVAGKENG